MALLDFLGRLFLGLLGKLCHDECKAWLPRITERILRTAVRVLPADLRVRYDEEWRADLNEIPGELGRLLWSLSLVLAAFKIFDDNAFVSLSNRIAALLIIVCLGPTLLLIALLIKLTSSGPVLLTHRVRYGEHLVGVRSFRTISSDPKKLGPYAILHVHLRMTPMTVAEEAQLKRIFRVNPPFTLIGRFLFYFDIDQLPMLLDVLGGRIPL